MTSTERVSRTGSRPGRGSSPSDVEKINLRGIEVSLAAPDDHLAEWVDYDDYRRLLEAAWLRLSDTEPPLNPRLIGDPGLGKTTLVCATARHIGRPLYIFQCTMDTRPEDLLITPVLTADKRIEYRAAAVVSAMVKGGVLLLDEGNRMPERSWASLAPMLDGRRYVESALTALKIHAHPDFRVCVTMNDDTSTYELPGYIRSRLKPKIEIVAPPWEVQAEIVRLKCPGVDEDLLVRIFEELKRRARDNRNDSIRDMLSLAEYAQKLRTKGVADPLERAVKQVLSAPGSPSARDAGDE
jgi:MoxR-like ATPase